MHVKFHRLLSVLLSLSIVACNDNKPTATQSAPPKAESTPNITAQIANESKIGKPSDNPKDYETDYHELKTQAEIDKLVDSIPNLRQGLLQNDLKVTSVNYGHYTKDEIDISQGLYQKGDIDYSFHTTEPADTLSCPIWSTFSIDKRGKKWLPQSKTASYLMTGKCEIPKLQ